MGWLSRKTSANATTIGDIADDESSVERPSPRILPADGEEGAELVFTDTFSTPTKRPKEIEPSTPRTLPDHDEEKQYISNNREEESRETASSVLLNQDNSTSEMTRVTTRRSLALAAVLLVLLAIILGIVLGTRQAREDEPLKVVNNDTDTDQEEPIPSTKISNDKCSSATNLLPDGSADVAVLSSASQTTFTSGAGTCGVVSYAGQGPGKWYSIMDMEGLLQLSSCTINCTAPANALAIPETILFTGTCDDLFCLKSASNLLTDGPLQFQAVLGQNYYVYIQGGQGTLGLLEVVLDQV